MYQSKEEAKLQQECREEQEARSAQARTIWERVENGARKLSREDFDALPPRQRLHFHHLGGQIG